MFGCFETLFVADTAAQIGEPPIVLIRRPRVGIQRRLTAEWSVVLGAIGMVNVNMNTVGFRMMHRTDPLALSFAHLIFSFSIVLLQ